MIEGDIGVERELLRGAEIGPHLGFVFDHKGALRSSLDCLVDGSRRIAGFSARRTPLMENQGKPQRTPASSGSRNGEGLLRRGNLEAMLVGDPVTRNITNTKQRSLRA